jgi:hypothetical protein
MKKMSILFVTVILCLGTALPAHALFVSIDLDISFAPPSSTYAYFTEGIAEFGQNVLYTDQSNFLSPPHSFLHHYPTRRFESKFQHAPDTR